ncbi:MAG TPA: BatA domain-containing protein [Verrucomicrobiales bacterium]|nr:BatA domain-containing protein [Verrucomicrobiales bacterium]
MSFLQPFLLLGLPLIAIPVIIHLLNKRRHRTMPWAAMMFLQKATRQSRGRKKLRHFLILACRVLAIATLLFAASRPLAGSFLGWAFQGSPETILVLLDRSASMELSTAGLPAGSKRSQALHQLGEAASRFGRSRLTVIDSASLSPQYVEDAASLPDLPSVQATDTQADIPAMLDRALDFVAANQSGRTDIWLVSDLQTNDWRPGDNRWRAIRERFRSLPQDVRLRIMAFDASPTDNQRLSLSDVSRRQRPDADELLLTLQLERDGTALADVPLAVVIEGARTVEPVNLTGQSLRFQRRVPLGGEHAGGWGWVEIPNDANPRDNTAFFVYSAPQTARSVLIANSGRAGAILALAAAPAPEELNQTAEAIAAHQLGTLDWPSIALVVWQAPLPTGADAEALLAFLESGGRALFLPTGQPSGPAEVFLDLSYGELESAPGEDGTFAISTWRQDDGPLADTQDGNPLPLGRLAARQRQPVLGDAAVFAQFSDGKPFLVRRDYGAGAAWFGATLPLAEWSDLGDGPVLVPMVQRILGEGSQRLGNARRLICGEPLPPNLQEQPWTRLDGASEDAPSGQRYTAGVYQAGETLFSLNRPEQENRNQITSREELESLLEGARFTYFEAAVNGRDRSLASEIWRLFLYAMLFFLLGEALLCLPSPAQLSASRAPAAA